MLDWNFPELRQEKYKMILEHVVVPQSKEVLKKKKIYGGLSNGQRGVA